MTSANRACTCVQHGDYCEEHPACACSCKRIDPLEAFVHGRQIPAHIRWAETEAMIRAGEWTHA